MVYCSKCGQKNSDDAKFCNSCGKSLYEHPWKFEKRPEDRCDDECSGKKKTPLWTTFWVLFLLIIAAGLIFTLFQRIFSDRLPDWIAAIKFWDICWIIVPLLIVIFILYALSSSLLHRR